MAIIDSPGKTGVGGAKKFCVLLRGGGIACVVGTGEFQHTGRDPARTHGKHTPSGVTYTGRGMKSCRGVAPGSEDREEPHSRQLAPPGGAGPTTPGRGDLRLPQAARARRGFRRFRTLPSLSLSRLASAA